MRYLKKVSVTSNDTSGKIIDSFFTGDNHTVNAPSLNAVEERVAGYDNNLLIAGDFVEWGATRSDSAEMPLGWVGENTVAAVNMGVGFIAGYAPTLKSPLYIASWNLSDADDAYYPLCLTVEYSLNGTIKTKSIEVFKPTIQATYTVDEIATDVNLMFTNTATAPNTRGACINLFVSDTIPSGTVLYIRRVKLEKGSKSTGFLTPSPIYAALTAAFRGYFAQAGEVAGLKVFEFNGTLPTTTTSHKTHSVDSSYSLAVLASYAYNRNENKYYNMDSPSIVGGDYYRPTIYCYGNTVRVDVGSTALNNYTGQAYKIFCLGWKNS